MDVKFYKQNADRSFRPYRVFTVRQDLPESADLEESGSVNPSSRASFFEAKRSVYTHGVSFVGLTCSDCFAKNAYNDVASKLL